MTDGADPTERTRRLIALGVFMVCAALMLYIHREDLASAGLTLPGSGSSAGAPASTADTPFDACVRKADADIGGMVADGVIGEAQAGLFRERAAARCRAQHPE